MGSATGRTGRTSPTWPGPRRPPPQSRSPAGRPPPSAATASGRSSRRSREDAQGNRGGTRGAVPPVAGRPGRPRHRFAALLADKGYDSRSFRDACRRDAPTAYAAGWCRCRGRSPTRDSRVMSMKHARDPRAGRVCQPSFSSGSTQTRSRPACLAAYTISSARASRPLGTISILLAVIPMLTVTVRSLASSCHG
jgi:hypothetical protein